jgi:Tfp pilus assembly protein PilW
MHVTPLSLDDESGTTMVELLVGMAMGMVVLVGLTMTIIAVMHGTSRVDARVEATDNARLTVTRITEELHSACTSAQIAPVREGSNELQLIFWHAAPGQASAPVPVPVKSKIVYSNRTLTQTDFAKTGGTSPNWTFEGEGENHGLGSTRTLLTNVEPDASGAVFSYAKFVGGAPATATVPLTKTEAEATIEVKIALTASPKSSPVADKGSSATVKDSATLRLTPPSYEAGASALPCQ